MFIVKQQGFKMNRDNITSHQPVGFSIAHDADIVSKLHLAVEEKSHQEYIKNISEIAANVFANEPF